MITKSILICKLRHVAIAGAVAAMQVGGLCAQTVIRTTFLSPPYLPGSPLGTWSGNSIVAIESSSSSMPILHIYDQSGTEAQRVALQLPGAQLVNIIGNQFARSTDGYLAVTGSAYGSDRGAVFLAVISPDGTGQLIVRTDPYVPYALAFAADGTLWAAGQERDDPEEKNGTDGNYFIIRRFDKRGRLLGGAVPRTLFPGREVPVTGSHLVASKDRVGWFSPRAHRYMEFSLDGKELATYPLSLSFEDVDGVALCDDNTLWASVKSGKVWVPDPGAGKGDEFPASTLTFLDRARGTLSGGKAQPFVYLYGCSGNTLVATSATSRGWNEVDWIKPR